MFEAILNLIQSTIKTGIGQAIIAFGAWLYVLVLLLVTGYYLLLTLVRLTLKKRTTS